MDSFSASLERGIFQCFACGAKGNLLEFAVLMEDGDQRDGAALRKVAVSLHRQLVKNRQPERKIENRPLKSCRFDEAPVETNTPLDFELRGLDDGHPYFEEHHLSKETANHFGLGYCTRGMLKGRIAIPLHDAERRLVGYGGRTIDDRNTSEENPFDLFPARRVRNGVVFEFKLNRLLYNALRIGAPVQELVVVEDFSGVWWLHQNGFREVVATLGADCSPEQAEQIFSLVEPAGRVWLLPSNDESGREHARSLLFQLAQQRFVRWLKLGEGIRPTDLSREQLRGCFRTV